MLNDILLRILCNVVVVAQCRPMWLKQAMGFPVGTTEESWDELSVTMTLLSISET